MPTALLLGATGLVGGHVLRELARSARYDHVVTLGRRPLARIVPHHAHHVVDFDALAARRGLFASDDVFCCLGTTIRQAGSRAAFRRVDLGYPAVAAQLARDAGARQFLLVSAIGADAGAPFFYSRVKGEAEDTIGLVGFEAYHVFRPSLLTGDRNQTRVGESVAEALLTAGRPLLVGPLRALRPTPASALARVMVEVAAEEHTGRHVYEAPEILARAGL
ncbi:MAG: NAD(P)H-binding protein [Rubricoccaceae bacterium]